MPGWIADVICGLKGEEEAPQAKSFSASGRRTSSAVSDEMAPAGGMRWFDFIFSRG